MFCRQMIALCAIGLAVSACGGSSGKTSPRSTASPSSTPTTAALTAARAQQLATAAILRDSDLPGYTSKPQTHTASDVTDENTGRKCVGLPAPAHYLARNFGTSFTKGTQEIDSSADVAFSVAQAHEDLRALTSSKAPDCFKQGFVSALAAEGLTVRSFSANLSTAEIPGADATFAYKYSISATTQGQQVQLVGYEVGALVGQIEIDLTVFGLSPLDVTFADTERLTGTSVSRVKTAEVAT